MIYLTVMGRCGNQMFQYAFARRLADVQNDRITVNFGALQSYVEDERIPFQNELSSFSASERYETIYSKDDLIRKYGSLPQKTIYKLYRLLRKLYGRIGQDPHQAEDRLKNCLAYFGIYLDTGDPKKTFTIKRCHEKNLFLRGYFEYPPYFEPIHDTLMRDYEVLHSASDRNAALLSKITSANSVCVSFRKWDVTGRDTCNREYYLRAFEYIKKRVVNPVFVIFSNDVAWVKENFPLPEECLFEEGENPVWEKVLLMSSCRHFIICNSSFAWWVQFLGKYERKIVISPRKWYEDENMPNHLLMKHFVLL